MTIEDVAQNLKMHWNTIKDIEKRCLQRRYKHIDLSGLERIAIDEFAIRKGHIYQTVVMDLDKGRIIYVAKGRTLDCLNGFWSMLKRHGIKLKAVAMDMWPAYIGSVIENSPETKIVFDKFHIIKKMNEAIDNTRRSLYAMETELNKQHVFKGLRWLLLMKNDNLNETGKEKLQRALNMNQPLAEAYYLKEELGMLWEQATEDDANKFIDNWCDAAFSTGITHLRKFANMLKAHRSGILNWFNHPISTGPLEGINNKIKVLKRKAYGYRDMEFFNLKILNLHHSRYALL